MRALPESGGRAQSWGRLAELRLTQGCPPRTASTGPRLLPVRSHRCMSPACYGGLYERDALEEGEEEGERGAALRACMLREARQARAVALGLPPQPRRTPGYKHTRG